MIEERLSQNILECYPLGRRRRRRRRRRKAKSQNSWMLEVTTGLREKCINIYRQGRMEKKNKTLSTEMCENIDTMHISK